MIEKTKNLDKGTENMAPKITELDHIVLNVEDIEKSLAFYIQTLGLKGERVQDFREEKVGFPSVRINEHTIIDLNPVKNKKNSGGEKVQGNLNHFCLVVSQDDFSGISDYLRDHGVQIVQGPVSRWGARGRATSVYFLDPDGNEIEIRCY
jgi:catechol 2,3-dioxygenase-like lactoylglutathione lyase family enzyme